MTLSDYFFELITEEAIAFSKLFIPMMILLVVFRLVQINIWKDK